MLYQRYFLRMNQSNMTHVLTLLVGLAFALGILLIVKLKLNESQPFFTLLQRSENLFLAITLVTCIAIYAGDERAPSSTFSIALVYLFYFVLFSPRNARKPPEISLNAIEKNGQSHFFPETNSSYLFSSSSGGGHLQTGHERDMAGGGQRRGAGHPAGPAGGPELAPGERESRKPERSLLPEEPQARGGASNRRAPRRRSSGLLLHLHGLRASTDQTQARLRRRDRVLGRPSRRGLSALPVELPVHDGARESDRSVLTAAYT